MKYPIVLKYNYSYVSSGNYYKKAEREYYQLFKEDLSFEMFAFGFTSTDKQVKIKSISENEIACEHTFGIYAKPNTFSKEHEVITNSFVLKKGKAIESECYEMYWRYASGGENGPATLRVEWITYDQFYDECLKNAKMDSGNAIRFASHLIKAEEYDTAFGLLEATGEDSNELALCYEMGYGTKIDLHRALNMYLKRNNPTSAEGIERIILKLEGKKIVFDDVERAALLEKLGKYKEAYYCAEIPRKLEGHEPETLRRNVELTIIRFLTLGRPHNDPMRYPAAETSHTTRYLAEYYDLINGVPENERKVYYKRWEERDEYEGGTNTKERFYEENIIETLRAEAEKGDIIAQAVLAIQYYDKVDDHAHFAELLDGCKKEEKGLGYYFLGLYYNYAAQKAETEQDCLANTEKALSFFERSLNKDFHLAVAPLAKVIAEEEPTRAYEILKGHEPYIPSIGNSFTDDYYKLLKSLEENKR